MGERSPGATMPPSFHDPAHAAAFSRWFRNSRVLDERGQPLVVYNGMDRGHARLSSFHGVAYFTEDPREASAYALTSAGHDRFKRAEQLRRQLAKMVSPPAPLPKRFDVFDDTWPIPSDYVGDPNRYFVVDNTLYWAAPGEYADEVKPTLVKGVRVSWRGTAGHPVAVMSTTERALRESAARALKQASASGPVVTPAYLSIQRPFVSTSPLYVNQFSTRWRRDTQQAALAELRRLKALGYDGIIGPTDTVAYDEDGDDATQLQTTVYLPFSPQQVKSAIGNRGTFSRRSGDVRNPAPRRL